VISDARELHHVSVVVASIEGSLPFYRDVLGLTPGPVRTIADQRVRAVFLEASHTRIELIEPTDATSGAARFLAERGRSSLHHLCFVVDDLRSTLRALEARGVELIDHEPRRGLYGMRVAFVNPDSVDGVLAELVSNGR